MKLNGLDRQRSAPGFTLIELMIVIAIIAILASIAVPLYSDYVESSRRTDGKTLLLDTTQTLERCFSTYGSYDDSDCAIINSSNTLDGNIESEDAFYVIQPSNVTINSATFTLQADTQGAQTSDTSCGALTIDHAGSKGAKKGTVDECW